jgi:signal transduction histidine kinase
MKSLADRRLTRPLQLAFLVLLFVCTAQLAWWLVDEVRYTAEVQQRLIAAHEAEAEAARAMLRGPVARDEIARTHPALTLGAGDSVAIAPAVLDELRARRFHRLNRYAWEGAFFLVVLIAAMAVVYRTLRDEAELRRRQEEFLAAVSHELKSPLASLRLSVETLAMRDPASARRSELLSRSMADLNRLQRMIANILDVSRLSGHESRSAPERLVLSDEIAAVVSEVRDYASEHAARVHVNVPPDLVIRADSEGVRTIVRNLVDNAIKATAGGGEVVLRAAQRDGRVGLEVRDNGIGFPSDEAPRLFQKFYRARGDARFGGTGLGLFLVRLCAQLDGATVAGWSDGPGKGATFTVSWPALPERST